MKLIIMTGLSILLPWLAFAKSHIFILYGATEKGKAEEWLKKFDRAKSEISFYPGYPKVLDSATVKGLNPGFYIVVAGYCPNQVANDSLLIKETTTILSKRIPGSYSKAVEASSTLKSECPLMERGFQLNSPQLEREALKKAESYNEEGLIDELNYMSQYVLMLNPKNKTALGYVEKVMVLKTE